MTDPLPHSDLYEQLLRERYGDPAVVAREATASVPPPGAPTPTTPRADRDHERADELLARHPDWPRELGLLGDGGVAHVLTGQVGELGVAVCRRSGVFTRAPRTTPVCRACLS